MNDYEQAFEHLYDALPVKQQGYAIEDLIKAAYTEIEVAEGYGTSYYEVLRGPQAAYFRFILEKKQERALTGPADEMLPTMNYIIGQIAYNNEEITKRLKENPSILETKKLTALRRADNEYDQIQRAFFDKLLESKLNMKELGSIIKSNKTPNSLDKTLNLFDTEYKDQFFARLSKEIMALSNRNPLHWTTINDLYKHDGLQQVIFASKDQALKTKFAELCAISVENISDPKQRMKEAKRVHGRINYGCEDTAEASRLASVRERAFNAIDIEDRYDLISTDRRHFDLLKKDYTLEQKLSTAFENAVHWGNNGAASFNHIFQIYDQCQFELFRINSYQILSGKTQHRAEDAIILETAISQCQDHMLNIGASDYKFDMSAVNRAFDQHSLGYNSFENRTLQFYTVNGIFKNMQRGVQAKDNRDTLALYYNHSSTTDKTRKRYNDFVADAIETIHETKTSIFFALIEKELSRSDALNLELLKALSLSWAQDGTEKNKDNILHNRASKEQLELVSKMDVIITSEKTKETDIEAQKQASKQQRGASFLKRLTR
jgi:hypothetical protein